MATVAPVITSSTTNISAGAATITINGVGFDPAFANNSLVVFTEPSVTNGTVAGSVTSADTAGTWIIVTFTTGKKPVAGHTLSAQVTTNLVPSTAVQVGTAVS